MLMISRLGRIATKQTSILTKSIFLRTYVLTYNPINPTGSDRTKQSTQTLLDKFDPENDPKAASAIYTDFGWFYIPDKFNTVFEATCIIQEELIRAGCNQDTPKEEIQNFIYSWCLNNTPIGRRKNARTKKSLATKSVHTLFEEKSTENGSSIEDGEDVDGEDKTTKKISKTNAIKATEEQVPKSKKGLRMKLNNETGEYEILSDITSIMIFNYFYGKRIKELRDGGNMSKKEASAIARSEWSEKNLAQRYPFRKEFIALLKSGKDLCNGEIIPLTWKLYPPGPDGVQIRSSQKLALKYRT